MSSPTYGLLHSVFVFLVVNLPPPGSLQVSLKLDYTLCPGPHVLSYYDVLVSALLF